MTDGRPDFELLNAYVDGELDAERASDVANAVARDPGLAREVAMITRLRSAIAESVEVPPLDLPRHREAGAGRRGWALAAGLAAFVVAGTMLAQQVDRPLPYAWLVPALKLHAAWAPPVAGFEPVGNGVRVTPAAGPALARAYVPDLTAAKLYVAYVSEGHRMAGRDALVVGYTGTRGCKVTLVVAPSAAPLDEEPVLFERGGREAYAWRTGRLDYLLVAEGMDAERFRLIAETVHRTSVERLPVDTETRTALLDSRRRSAPCLA